MEMLSFDLWLLWMCVEAAAKLQTFYFILFFTLGEWTALDACLTARPCIAHRVHRVTLALL